MIEESTESLATANPAHRRRGKRPVDDLISEALVIALAMAVLDKRCYRLSQVALSEGESPG